MEKRARNHSQSVPQHLANVQDAHWRILMAGQTDSATVLLTQAAQIRSAILLLESERRAMETIMQPIHLPYAATYTLVDRQSACSAVQWIPDQTPPQYPMSTIPITNPITQPTSFLQASNFFAGASLPPAVVTNSAPSTVIPIVVGALPAAPVSAESAGRRCLPSTK